jgi:RNA 2',3'-cyclic 3'-phosphodiesterase
MQRLFVAIQPPLAIRERLLAAMGGVINARWQSDEQLHLTLRFIGEVDRHGAADIAAALGMIHHSRFTLSLDRIGQFDRRGKTDSLWVGVTPHDAVEGLKRKVDQALLRVGIAPEQRAYQPHITLARFTRKPGDISDFAARSGQLASLPFAVDHFILYESHLATDGAAYIPLARYPLDRPR